MVQLWEVIGGGGKDGILVRGGRELGTPKLAERLATGALVEELELAGERLHFRLLSGAGPRQGWVSISLPGRELVRRVAPPELSDLWDACRAEGVEPLPAATEADLVRALADLGVTVACRIGALGGSSEPVLSIERRLPQKDTEGAAWVAEVQEFDAYRDDPYHIFGIPHDATDAVIKSAFRKLSLKFHPDRCPGDEVAAAKFRQLTLAKEFLLDPYQRRAFNEARGFLTPTVNVAWWSDWDEIFAEIEPEEEAVLPQSHSPFVPRTLPDGTRVDLLILGATGITGTLACMVMQRRGDSGGHTWAIAGRDGRRLQLLEHKFGKGRVFGRAFRAETRQELEQAVRTARVVLDCSGPSHDVGTVVAEACIRAGSHLVDNSGDIMFSRQVKDSLSQKAREAGVCLLLHAGYVSVPTDFGVWRVVRDVRERLELPTRRVDVYTYTQGFVMSGTSLLTGTQTTIKELNRAGGPFVLGGMRQGAVRSEDRNDMPHKDKDLAMMAYPGLMVERQVIRATCGLMDAVEPYGPDFLFKDWFLIVDKPKEEMTKQESAQASRLNGIGTSLGGAQSLMVERKMIPPPSWGPKERIRQETFVTKVFVAVADGGPERKMHVVMNAGPGGVGDRYEGTATAMIEAGCCLLENAGKVRGGWGTPVYHLAHMNFFDRLLSLGFSYQSFDGAPSSEFMQRVFSATLPIKDQV